MTVNELIQQLQEIPDGLKNCDIGKRSCSNFDGDSIINGILAVVNIECWYADMSIEAASKRDDCKYIILV